MKYIQVSTTVGKKVDAQRIAKLLCDKKLAACVHVVWPIESTYRWKGKLEKTKEWLCIAKTTARHCKAVEKAIKEVHSYDLPDIIVTPIVGGSKEYLGWISKQI